ncbi:hypothetical protein J8C02_09055 [Chloracidobacterium sp. MS 40/45]|uniref:hypothetical protein n=1 Tax=Chloracidobacterium aggregatum TaxID=2851959 RepID=UPI001B8BF9B6|nr:hypothetical protein [Chloracidobacterium aggregatum]QUV99562.1 hypothetical protein J8C02_09055 [Chloracidobacterium sp. MS 40/45]
MLRKFSRRQVMVGAVVSLATAVSPVLGQTRRATRIRFTPGASSSTVTGVLTRQGYRKYVLRANAGQTLTFAVSRTNPQVGVMVYDVEPEEVGGTAPVDGTSGHPVRTGEVILPATGDYFLYVSLVSDDAWPPPKAGIKFSLTVEIR